MNLQDRQKPYNPYHSVSIKVLEHIIHNYVSSYHSLYKLLSNHQFSFRSGYALSKYYIPTCHALFNRAHEKTKEEITVYTFFLKQYYNYSTPPLRVSVSRSWLPQPELTVLPESSYEVLVRVVDYPNHILLMNLGRQEDKKP